MRGSRRMLQPRWIVSLHKGRVNLRSFCRLEIGQDCARRKFTYSNILASAIVFPWLIQLDDADRLQDAPDDFAKSAPRASSLPGGHYVWRASVLHAEPRSEITISHTGNGRSRALQPAM